MLKNIYIIFVILLIGTGCKDRVVPPYLIFQVQQFDGSNISVVEKIVQKMAVDWKLELIAEDREHMMTLSQGKNAFKNYLVVDDKPILIIGNVGSGETLSIRVFDFGTIPLSKVTELGTSMKGKIETKLNLKFCKFNLENDMCI